MELKEVESAIEAILFAAGEPVGVERLCMTLEIDRETADAVCQRLSDQYSYERRGIRLIRLESCYQLCSAPEYADVIRKTFESRRPAKLSQPALEVLSIIAYFQPTTKAYVEQIRGVDSSYTVGLLVERDLIEECGRLAVPGRPIQYRTTQNFLRSFGLSSLEDLPPLPDPSAEDQQLTLDMEAGIARLQREGTQEESKPGDAAGVPDPDHDEAAAPDGAPFTDEELEAAAQELAEREGVSVQTEGPASDEPPEEKPS